MIRAPLFLIAVAILIAAALAWWPWRAELSRGWGSLGALARLIAITATLLLVLDPGIRLASSRARPLVLLDNSVSMHATGGSADSAASIAASLGEVTIFGEIAPGEPGGTTHLGATIAGAVAAGRPLVVLTDGEVHDVDGIPADLLAQAEVRVMPRRQGDNVAITDVRMPGRLAAGDTLHFEVDVRVQGNAPDSVRVELRDSTRVLAAAAAPIGPGRDALTLRGEALLPSTLEGERFIEIVRVGASDSEPLDDRRWRRVLLAPSPGIVVIAATPDWDARALLATLAQVTAAPVRGYIQMQRGRWYRMDDLQPVAEQVVERAAAGADLLAVRGDTTRWRSLGAARILWSEGQVAADWYLTSGGPSPVSAALIGVEPDSLPPLPAVSEVPGGEWVGLVARRSRRGAEIPVMAGRERGGRTVVIGASGFHAWALQGGTPEQVWRTSLGQAVEWLLSAPASGGAPVRSVDHVVQRGRAVRFRLDADTALAAIEFSRAGETRSDTLRADADGIARVALSPGRWYWQSLGIAGEVVVEDYSDELLPGPVTLTARDAAVTPEPARRSLRELWPLFAIAIAGFVAEWLIRRKLAIR